MYIYIDIYIYIYLYIYLYIYVCIWSNKLPLPAERLHFQSVFKCPLLLEVNSVVAQKPSHWSEDKQWFTHCMHMFVCPVQNFYIYIYIFI